MHDFLIAAGVTIGGGYLVSKLSTDQAIQQQQASCASKQGTWKSYGTYGTCYVGGGPVATQYTMWSPTVVLGVPVAVGILLTRSGGGLLGAAVGAGLLFMIAISGIH
jgi:hypothetical protein